MEIYTNHQHQRAAFLSNEAVQASRLHSVISTTYFLAKLGKILGQNNAIEFSFCSASAQDRYFDAISKADNSDF